MGINSSAVMLGSSVPPPQTDAGQASPTNNATNAGSQDGSSTGAADTSGSLSSGQKAAGPSTQTRNNTRGARTRNTGSGSTSNPVSTDPQASVPQPVTNFGSVMASALGRTGAGKDAATPATVPTSNAADSTDSKGRSTSATPATTSRQQAQGAADAVTWIAQAIMPPATGAAALAGSGTDTGAAGNVSTTGPVSTGAPADSSSAAADAQTVAGLTAQLAAQDAAATGKSPRTAANAARTAAATDSVDPQGAPTTDAQTTAVAAAAAGPINLIALAGAQKLVSGLAVGVDADADASTPTTHATTPSGNTDDAQAAATLQAAALPHTSAAPGAATLTIHSPMGSVPFADEVGARVTGLAQSGITQAQLQLNPADLGPVQVHITLQAGQASVWFGATHADTRAALEQSLPRLRELFAGAGMPLTDSGVFREPPQQQQPQPLSAASSLRSSLNEPQPASTVTQVSTVRLSLLDTYA